jgi:putative PIN family toxin of toxin-antitoxin system
LRVVFDTNIYISAFITPGGRAETALLRAVNGEVTLFTSIPILTETAGKLREKFKWDDEHITAAVRHAAAVGTIVKPAMTLAVLADEPDNRILECALEAKAGVIVTGDRHLLDLGEYEGVVIVTLAKFLEGGVFEALWVREAETRYDEIATSKVVCRPLDEAVEDARRALK